MDKDTVIVQDKLLNERIPVKLAFKVGFIKITDPSIDEEKRAVYKLLAKTKKIKNGVVPYIKLFDIYFDPDLHPWLIRHLSQKANFPSQSVVQSQHSIGIFSERFNVFLSNDENDFISNEGYLWNMLFNSKSDDMFNYLFAVYCGDENLSKALYISGRDDHRAFYKNLTGPHIESFLNYANNVLNIKEFVTKPNPNYGPPLDITGNIKVGLKTWAPFMNRVLFSNTDSKLYNEDGTRGYKMNQFEFSVLDIDDRSRDWKSIFAAYKEGNPETRQTGISLADTPADYQVADRKFLNIVIYDNNENKMVGYITCSLHIATTTIIDDRQQQTNRSRRGPVLDQPYADVRELNRLNKRLIERGGGDGDKYDGIGYDIFAIDGIHVHPGYRKTVLKQGVTISKIMIFMALEFVRVAQRELGVSMVMAYSLAIQTKQILVGTFGFSHYNKTQELEWIKNSFSEYLLSMNPSETTLIEEDPKFLSFSVTVKSLEKFRDTFFPTKRGSSIAYTQITTNINTVIDSIQRIINNYLVYSIVGGRSRLPITKSGLDEIKWSELEKIEILFETVLVDVKTKKSKQEKLLAERMKKFIGVADDTDDTFLTLSPEFDDKMNSFYTKMTSPVITTTPIISTATERFENIDVVPVVGKISRVTEELILLKEKRQSEPTEEDMRIYLMVETLYNTTTNNKRITVVIEDSEEEVEEVLRPPPLTSNDREVVVVEMERRLLEGLASIERRVREIEELERELRLLERNEMNFGKLLLVQ